MPIIDFDLTPLVQESNRIEGIYETRRSDVLVHKAFLEKDVTVQSLSDLVYGLAGAKLRNREDMNVRVGEHVAPQGGSKLVFALEKLLAERSRLQPAHFHQHYLYLHPFMDGNGRSARALYFKTMLDCGELGRTMQLGFLHDYYYRSLDLADRLIVEGALALPG